MPPRTAPMIGATQKSQSCAVAQFPTNNATPVLRAGFTDVFVTGILIKWINVKPKPIAIGANPCGARLSVAPRIISRNIKVITISVTRHAMSVYPPGE